MNLAEHIEQRTVSEEKIGRLENEVHFYERSIRATTISILGYDEEYGVDIDYGSSDHVADAGIIVEISYNKRWHSFTFIDHDVATFIYNMARALPDDFDKEDIFHYLTRIDSRDVV